MASDEFTEIVNAALSEPGRDDTPWDGIDAIPDGWAKVDGEWVEARRCYLGGDTTKPTNEWVVIGPEVA